MLQFLYKGTKKLLHNESFYRKAKSAFENHFQIQYISNNPTNYNTPGLNIKLLYIYCAFVLQRENFPKAIYNLYLQHLLL